MAATETRLDALKELAAKVEAGVADKWEPEFERALFKPYGMRFVYIAGDAYEGSLDAAKALHEAVLPGWEWSLDRDGAVVWIENPDRGPHISEGTPARAWLLAIIKALIAQEMAR